MILCMSASPTPQRREQPRDTFSSRLVLLRHDLGISQAQAARLCGVSQAAWSNWEGGEIPRDQGSVVNKIAVATGYRREWLMWGSAGGSERPDPEPSQKKPTSGGYGFNSRHRLKLQLKAA
jgi:transcriptional regulator with XRE-family HTH domain